MKIQESNGKKVRITCKDRTVLEGIACDYIPHQDNVPEIASISVGDIEVYENEILSIVEIQ